LIALSADVQFVCALPFPVAPSGPDAATAGRSAPLDGADAQQAEPSRDPQGALPVLSTGADADDVTIVLPDSFALACEAPIATIASNVTNTHDATPHRLVRPRPPIACLVRNRIGIHLNI
jgi:hypothetical protein